MTPIDNSPGHTHLDAQRRAEGECPACDAAWLAQRERLASTRMRMAADRKPPPPPPPKPPPKTSVELATDRRTRRRRQLDDERTENTNRKEQ